MPTVLYKGSSIVSLPEQNRYSGRWSVTVHISGAGRNITIYKPDEFDTQEAAETCGFNEARDWIDRER